MDGASLHEELLLGLRVVRIRNAAVDGTHGGALLLVEEADALGALLGNNVIDLLRDGRMALAVVLPRRTALVDRRVGAFRLAGAAVDALLGDHRRHRPPSLQWHRSDDNLERWFRRWRPAMSRAPTGAPCPPHVRPARGTPGWRDASDRP